MKDRDDSPPTLVANVSRSNPVDASSVIRVALVVKCLTYWSNIWLVRVDTLIDVCFFGN